MTLKKRKLENVDNKQHRYQEPISISFKKKLIKISLKNFKNFLVHILRNNLFQSKYAKADYSPMGKHAFLSFKKRFLFFVSTCIFFLFSR
jgi:hypothetical protein